MLISSKYSVPKNLFVNRISENEKDKCILRKENTEYILISILSIPFPAIDDFEIK